jgi:hypothetical protein
MLGVLQEHLHLQRFIIIGRQGEKDSKSARERAMTSGESDETEKKTRRNENKAERELIGG